MSGCVVWFTGLPSSGKSTLARRVLAALRARSRAACLLDGDEVRGAVVPAHGHDPAGRAAFYETLARLAALLEAQGIIVLVPATANLVVHRQTARRLAGRFLEVHVATPLATCRARDAKGLYARAERGELGDLPGLGAEYQPPAKPDVVAPDGDDEDALRRVLAAVEG